MNSSERTTKRFLEPHERIAEVLFGLIMVLAITGSLSARLSGTHRGRAVLRLMVGGALAMVVTYGIGRLVGSAL